MVTERRSGVPVATSSPTSPPTSPASPASVDELRELRDAVAARDELIAVIGHELRNAMAPLVLLAPQLEATPGADDLLRAKLAMLARQLNRFVGTLDRVGEVAELREGKLALALADVDAQDVVRDVAGELTELATRGGCELRLDTQSVVGRWDRARLGQIVRHLVRNAIKHAGGGPIEIAVRADATRAEIVVQDAGPGIAAAEREHLFDRFEHKRTRRTGGLGIGLWVVKSLCIAMGGAVRLDDTARGARFCVALPRG